MLSRIRPLRVLELARRDVPAPVDVINLIDTARFDRYRWYGVLVLPVMTAAGGRVLWMARQDESLLGAPQCNKLLVVRYPSHRRFLAMTLNPYYLAINRLREAGVRRFEASFTHASHCEADLRRRRQLVGVHFRGELGGVVSAMQSAGCELVYATRATAPIGFLDPPQPTDPNPLTFAQLALFAVPDGRLPDVAGAVAAVVDDCSVQLYRCEHPSEYVPPLVQRLRGAS
jgi:uncharacterized protein (DUF1330 family)